MLPKKTSALVLTILIIGAVALAQENQFGNIAERQRASTVLGGTGMFNTFSTRTLYKGEFNFAAFWNRFNRSCVTTITVHPMPAPQPRPEVIKPCGPIVFPFNSSRPEPVGAPAAPDSRFATSGSTTTNARNERRRAPASVVWAVSANMVDGAVRVVVHTDGAVQYKDFILSGPSRIVIDLTGVRSALGSKTIPVAGGLVDRVRVGEPGPGAVRIVIDVRAMTRYLVLKDGSALIIIIGEEGVVAGSGGSR